jgi:hypothetical protein
VPCDASSRSIPLSPCVTRMKIAHKLIRDTKVGQISKGKMHPDQFVTNKAHRMSSRSDSEAFHDEGVWSWCSEEIRWSHLSSNVNTL